VESFARSITRSLTVVTRGLVVPSLRLVAVTPLPELVVPSLGLVAPTRGLVVPSLWLVAPTWGLVIPSLRLVAPCTRVVHGLSGHRLRARLVLETLRVVACLELAPTPRPWRAAAAIAGAGKWPPVPVVVAAVVAFVALAAPAWHPIPGVRSSAIFVIVTFAVVASPTVHLATAVAIAATAATRCTTRRATATHSVTSPCNTSPRGIRSDRDYKKEK
jgi:hypothetical protein